MMHPDIVAPHYQAADMLKIEPVYPASTRMNSRSIAKTINEILRVLPEVTEWLPVAIVQKYGLHILDGVSNMEPVVDAFWKTFHWTIYYFKTNEVLDWGWVYPYPEAPLIQSIVELYETIVEPSPLNYNITNQLQFILPSKALHVAKRRVLYANEFYEETRETWMKRYDWEMKPRISIPWSPKHSLTSVSPL
jgi:hypothetical protein